MGVKFGEIATKRLKISELKCANFIMLSCIHSQYFVTYSEVYTHGSWTVPIWKSCNSLNWRVVFKAITYTRPLLGEVHVLQFQVQWSNSVENVLRNISACSLFLRKLSSGFEVSFSSEHFMLAFDSLSSFSDKEETLAGRLSQFSSKKKKKQHHHPWAT